MKIAPQQNKLPECCSLSVVTPELIMAAERSLPALYLEQWRDLPKYHESISARYLISRLIKNRFGIEGYLPETTSEGKPVFAENNVFWSISHAADRVLVAISDSPIGVDIEPLVARSPAILSLIQEEEWLSGEQRSWENFYRMWTAKEALVKKLLGKMDDILEMRVVSCLDDNCFIAFRGNLYSVEVSRRGNLIVAIAS